MKKARNRKELDVQEAGNLFSVLGQKNLKGYCLPVSLRALGGSVHAYHVLRNRDRIARLSTVEDYHLQTGYFLDVFTPMDLDYLEGIIQELTTARIDETFTKFTGILIHISFQEKEHPNNHYIALIPRQLLSGKVSRQLERTNTHVVIDTSSEPVVGTVHLVDLLDYVNQMIGHGAGVGFMQIFQK